MYIFVHKKMNICSTLLRSKFRNLIPRAASTASQPNAVKCKVKPGLTVRPAFKKLKETQKLFQIDDGNPVWLKRGLPDQILYQISVASVILGLLLSLKVFYDHSFANVSFLPKEAPPEPPEPPEECCKDELAASMKECKS